MHTRSRFVPFVLAALLLSTALGCGGKQPPAGPAAAPDPFPTPAPTRTEVPPPPPAPPPLPPPVPEEPVVTVDRFASMTLEDLNADSPLKPVFFAYDSDELDEAARRLLDQNAAVLRQYPTWVITIEGHCDERGTPEYNLALGDRRALAARTYLQSLGISADRLRTVSYGKEFPFDPGHDEAAWIQNRRAHFMVTSR